MKYKRATRSTIYRGCKFKIIILRRRGVKRAMKVISKRISWKYGFIQIFSTKLLENENTTIAFFLSKTNRKKNLPKSQRIFFHSVIHLDINTYVVFITFCSICLYFCGVLFGIGPKHSRLFVYCSTVHLIICLSLVVKKLRSIPYNQYMKRERNRFVTL